MQPTTRPWSAWQGWAAARRELMARYQQRRRYRPPAQVPADSEGAGAGSARRELDVDWARLHFPELAIYMPNQIRHMIRLEGPLSRPSQPLVLPTVPAAWLRHLQREPTARWRPDPTLVPPVPPPAAGPARALSWWEGGLPVGAVLLALLVLVVRLADKWLDTNIFKLRRRQSEEWPTPNVLATSHRPRTEADSLSANPRLADADFPSDSTDAASADLPPPYSECADAPRPKPPPLVLHDGPPPPYSACYVAYSNPKDGNPSVHFYNSRRQNLFGNRGNGHSSFDNTGDRDGDTGPSAASEGCDVNAGREYVFDNGRIVQRDASHRSENVPGDDNSGVVRSVENSSQRGDPSARETFLVV